VSSANVCIAEVFCALPMLAEFALINSAVKKRNVKFLSFVAIAEVLHYCRNNLLFVKNMTKLDKIKKPADLPAAQTYEIG